MSVSSMRPMFSTRTLMPSRTQPTTSSYASVSVLAIRSSFVTTMVSPAWTSLHNLSNSGRSSFVPVYVSWYISWHPSGLQHRPLVIQRRAILLLPGADPRISSDHAPKTPFAYDYYI